MKFGSVCSGIEAASVAWEPLGWEASWFSEIDPFASDVLKHHFPSIENHGDMATLQAKVESGEIVAPDVLCGGTPCQAFSLAGQRRSLGDDRGNLSLVFCNLADQIDETRKQNGQQESIIFWENVPGVLTTKDNAFGCFLGKMAGANIPLDIGGRWPNSGVVIGSKRTVAWRVLDAKYFGVAQRRRRVYVVASGRKDFSPAKILFERTGVTGGSGQSTETLQNPSRDRLQRSEGPSYGLDRASFNQGKNAQFDFSVWEELQPTLTARGPGAVCTFDNTLKRHVVRRLTPIECERLQGFPDNWTLVPMPGTDKYYSDTQRYRVLGNSWAVPVINWIGKRIDSELKRGII